MNQSGYSVLMAILWFSFFVVALHLMRKRNEFVLRYGLLPLLCLIITTLARLFLSVEFPFTRVVGSTEIMPIMLVVTDVPLIEGGRFAIDMLSLLVFVWFAVTAVLVVRFWLYYALFMKKVAAYPKVNLSEMHQTLRRITGRDVRLVLANDAEVPYIIGFFHPTVVLAGMDYEQADLELILMHEWQHFKNRDQWSKLLVSMICYVMWWNPLVYLLKRQLDQTLELRCDFRVLSGLSGKRRLEYAAMLLRVYKEIISRKDIPRCVPALITPRGGKAPSRLDGAGNIPRCIPALVQARKDASLEQRLILGINYDRIEKRNKPASVALCGVIILMFIASYTFIFQPRIMPSDDTGIFTSISENAYLVKNDSGSYDVFVDGQRTGTVKDITKEPFSSMPVR